jgi:hypothetical protein
MRRLLLLVSAIWLCACGEETPTTAPTETTAVTSLPSALDRSCRDGRARLYDECGSQTAIFQQALEEGRATGKTVIVSYGAEWCIWCHVFDNHLNGLTGRFSYPVEGEKVTLVERSGRDVLGDAMALNEYASRNLILVHIEGDHAPDGWQVIEATGAGQRFDQAYPFIFAVSPDGAFAAVLEDGPIETRRDTIGDWYRGYDRAGLLAELQRMRRASQTQPN